MRSTLREQGFVEVTIIGWGIVENLLNAYHRREPWNDFHDPKYLDGLLLSPKLKPWSVLLIGVPNKLFGEIVGELGIGKELLSKQWCRSLARNLISLVIEMPKHRKELRG